MSSVRLRSGYMSVHESEPIHETQPKKPTIQPQDSENFYDATPLHHLQKTGEFYDNMGVRSF